MGDLPKSSEKIGFVVGAEKDLEDLITEAEVLPLLKGAVRSGARCAMIMDAEGRPLWKDGTPVPEEAEAETRPFYLEGEMVGTLVVHGDKERASNLKGLGDLLFEAVHAMVANNLRRMLTTEIHTTVVSQSYEELLETNRHLRSSEARYRELAETLEQKVQDRTAKLERAYADLLQQEKMASVGQLAAGVAHEINNPMGFVLSNLHTLGKYAARFKEMLDYYRALMDKDSAFSEARKESEERWKELKLDYMLLDLEPLIGESLHGAERVKKIVSDLKGFSHIDDAEEAVVDINEEIDRTLNVLSHEIPEGTKVVRNYQALPGFTCRAASLSQAFLNILLNSLQARQDGLRLEIRTQWKQGAIRIEFSDNGPGIPDAIRNRVFEPFYTTKEVGKGKGMGLTVAYETVTSYGGTISVGARQGGGTTMIILLPAERAADVKVR